MIRPLELGATLYMPATRTDLSACIFGGRISGLRSCVICLEDSVAEADTPAGLAGLAAILSRHADTFGPKLFVRPRTPAMLSRIQLMPGADRLAGFVLPKVSATSFPVWLRHLSSSGQWIMPTLETREAFDAQELLRLRDQLCAVRERVLVVRIGGNDLLQCLGLRRPPNRTAYDGPLGPLIANLAGTFLPHGFALSAPVMERYDDPHLLRAEVVRDLEHGLTSKTAIHPAQLPVIHAALAVPSSELAEARTILSGQAAPVFGSAGRMCEVATHRRWAEAIVARSDLYGVADPLPIALPG